MKKVKNILWVIALLVIIVLIGIVGFNFYKKATMEVKNPIGSGKFWNNKNGIISRTSTRNSSKLYNTCK